MRAPELRGLGPGFASSAHALCPGQHQCPQQPRPRGCREMQGWCGSSVHLLNSRPSCRLEKLEAGGGVGTHKRPREKGTEARTQIRLPPRAGQVAPAPGRGSQAWWGRAAHPSSLPHQDCSRALGWSCPGKKWVPVPGQQGPRWPGRLSRGVDAAHPK